jgi:hypothetical protein
VGQTAAASSPLTTSHNHPPLIHSITRFPCRGLEIAGNIRREYPAEQAHRKWEIAGKLIGKDFIAIFWSDNPEITSHGCWHLRRENDSQYSGYYMKTDAGDMLSATPVRLDMVKK